MGQWPSAADLAQTVGEKRSFDQVLAEEHGLFVGDSRLIGAAQPAEEVGPGRCQVTVGGELCSITTDWRMTACWRSAQLVSATL